MSNKQSISFCLFAGKVSHTSCTDGCYVTMYPLPVTAHIASNAFSSLPVGKNGFAYCGYTIIQYYQITTVNKLL